MKTVSDLLAMAMDQKNSGPHRCFLCGSDCDEAHTVKEHILDSFTGRNEVVAPGSSFVCNGCILGFREDCEITFLGGVTRRQTKAAMRGQSWILTPEKAIAANKSHLDKLREICLAPPDPPFAIVLSDSGKKHLLYRGVVNHTKRPISLTLEGERIVYSPHDLNVAMELCGKLISATGKPALEETPTVRFAISVCERFVEGESLLTQWELIYGRPLSRLAVWLSGGREECQRAYPATRTPGYGTVSSEARWPDRSRS